METHKAPADPRRHDRSTRLNPRDSDRIDDIGSWSGLEVGVRYLDQVKTTVPEPDGSFSTTRPEYIQLCLGFTRRFDWPEGH